MYDASRGAVGLRDVYMWLESAKLVLDLNTGADNGKTVAISSCWDFQFAGSEENVFSSPESNTSYIAISSIVGNSNSLLVDACQNISASRRSIFHHRTT